METISQGQKLFLTRLAIGLTQGLVLYLLYSASEAKAWPATQGTVFIPVLLVSLAAPIGLILSLGAMSCRKSLIWVGIASIVIALLGFFDSWMGAAQAGEVALPSVQLMLFGAGGLFIAHALVTGGMTDGRFMASYPTHFDVAWKLAVQMALSVLFVGAFWLLLWLGAGLFGLIKLDFLRKLLGHEWFAIPVLSLATAGALHLTDIRPVLVQGARTLLLTLLSWLLPLITLIVAGFVASLPFTGLGALWNIGHATALLLAAAAALIVLINAAHQDGAAERMPPKILRLSGTIAAVLTVPLTVIAAYALFLRVQQYGWTVDRITVAAILVVALSYAGGYAHAALSKGEWLARLPRWNFVISLLALVLMVLLFTPIASPQRIAVNDQVARLRSGAISPGKFDYFYLRQHGGRYGEQALRTLVQDRDAMVKRQARNALEYRAGPHRGPNRGLTLQVLEDQITVHPRGERVPASFLKKDWSKEAGAAGCLTQFGLRCDLVLADLNGDQTREAIVVQNFAVQVFREANGDWQAVGNFSISGNCAPMMDALRRGDFRVVPPQHQWNDLELAGVRISMVQNFRATELPCPTR